MIDADGVLRVLESLRPHADGVQSTSGIRSHEAYLRMHSTTVEGRWVVIYSDGGTIWLQTDENYASFAGTENDDDDEYRETATYFMALASAYVRGDFERTTSRILREPLLRIITDGRPTVLSLSVDESLRRRFRRRTRSDEGHVR